MVRKNTFAYRFSEAVSEKGLSQDEVAKSLATSKSLVSQWANNKTVPALKNCKKLSKLLGVSVEYLLTGKSQDDNYDSQENKDGNLQTAQGDQMSDTQKQLGYIIDNGSEEDVEFLMGKIGRIFKDTKLKKPTRSSK